jgi:hypothetical protein
MTHLRPYEEDEPGEVEFNRRIPGDSPGAGNEGRVLDCGPNQGDAAIEQPPM